MAMTTCRECTETVSDGAMTCPHCGVKWPDATQAKRSNTAGVALVVLISVVVLFVLFLIVERLGI
jgi:hypothetical protein